MTTLIAAPFETADTLAATTVSGTVSIQNTTVPHAGEYAMQNNVSAAVGFVVLRGNAATGAPAEMGADSLYLAVMARIGTLPDASDQILQFRNSANTVMVRARLLTTGELECTYFDGTDSAVLLGTSAALSTGVWHLIELSARSVSAVGGATVEMRINGVPVASGSSLTIRSGSRTLDRIAVGSITSVTGNLFFGDPYVSDSVSLGESYVQVLHPTSDATNTFTTGGFADVDEMDGATNDGDSTFAKDSTSGHVLTCNFEALSGRTAASQIVAVVANMVVRDEGGASSFHGRLVSGATTDNWTDQDPGATYALRQKIYSTDPNTGAAWTLAAVNAIKFGLVNAANVAIRCTALALWVVYQPVSSRLPLLGVS